MKQPYYNGDIILGWIAIGVGLLCLIGAFLMLMAINPAVGRELVIASSYGDPQDIRRTGERKVATGKPLDPNGNYVAHRSLPLGTHLTLRHGHRAMMVTVNDRGPFIRGRTLDLTPAVNKYLQCLGLCRVKIESWPPLPKPRPDIPEPMFAWGSEENRP